MRALSRSLFASAVLVVLFTGHAGAAGAGLCDAFAAAITKRAAENAAYKCVFSSPNYNDPVAQRRWCRSVTEETAINESLRRDAETGRCAYCASYSNEANRQAKENVLFNCGFTGPRWGFGDGHRTWCMAFTPECASGFGMAAAAGLCKPDQDGMEEDARARAIKQCKAKYTAEQIDACTAYADKAVEQAKANDAKKCFTPGPRFSEDRDLHFSWCVGQIETDGKKMVLATKHESEARDVENNACKPVRRLGKLKPGGKNQLRPIPSSGESPFGAADKSGDKSGQAGFNQISGPAGQSTPSKIKSNSVKAAKGGGGFNTAKPSAKPVKSGSTAMDRLGGDSAVVPPGSAAGAGGRGGARAGSVNAGPAANFGSGTSSTSAGSTSGSHLNRGPAGASAIGTPSAGGFRDPK
jgi:hypothetical protein